MHPLYLPLFQKLLRCYQKDLLPKCFADLKYKPIRKITNIQAAPLINSVDYNVPWAKDIDLVNFLHESANEATFLEQLYKDVELKNNRVTFSPFGIHYHTGKTATFPLKPFTAQETKLFHYSFSDTSLEVFNQRPDAFAMIENHPYRAVLHERTARQLQIVNNTNHNDFDSSGKEFFSLEDDANGKFSEINDIDVDELDDDLDDDSLNDDDLNDADLDDDDLDDDDLDFEDTRNEILSENDDDDNFTSNNEKSFELNHKTTTPDLASNEELSNLSKSGPLWFREGTLFLNPNQYEPWQDLAWKGIVLQLLMYAGIELCVRIECRGIIGRTAPRVNDFIAHIDRMPEAIRISEYVGEKMKTPPVKKLLLAFHSHLRF